MVNIKETLVDYPNSKQYLKLFLSAITEKEIIDPKLQIVYEKSCEYVQKN